MSDDSSRARVRRLFEAATDDLDEINLPLIADEVTQGVKDDPELVALFLEEHLRPMVYQVGFSVLASQRANQHRIDAAARQVAAVVVPQTSPPTRVRGRLLRGSQKERTGFAWLRQPLAIAHRRQVRLEAARRPDLAAALERQAGRLLPARQRAMHYVLIHEGMPDDDQAVGDVFSDDEIGTLWVEARQRVAAQDRAHQLAAQAIDDRSKQRRVGAPSALPLQPPAAGVAATP